MCVLVSNDWQFLIRGYLTSLAFAYVFACDTTVHITRQWDRYSASSTTVKQFTAVCVCVCVCVRCWKREEIDQHGEERVHQQRLGGGCVCV